MAKILKEDIHILELKQEIENNLRQKGINKVGQLTNKTKTNLKDMNIPGWQITEIEIKLQLQGVDLGGNSID